MARQRQHGWSQDPCRQSDSDVLHGCGDRRQGVQGDSPGKVWQGRADEVGLASAIPCYGRIKIILLKPLLKTVFDLFHTA